MKKVECELCPRHCRIEEGGRGNCRIRTNVGGKLYSLVYGKPCAVHIDPIEKKPFFHILPGSSAFSIATAGCNLHCKFCQNWEISQRPPEETQNMDLPPEEVVRQAMAHNCRSIAYTYSDPVVFYEYTYDTSSLAQKQGLLNVLVTAGYIEQKPLVELCKVIHAANVDIKSMSDDFYRNMSEATLKPVLDCVVTMKKMGLWVEITNLLVPTLNDSEKDIRSLCRWILQNGGADMPLHFSRFWPLHKLQNLPPTPVETLTRAWDIAKEEGLHYVYVGNVPSHPGNNTYCPNDGKLLIGRQGFEVTENHVIDGKCEYCGTQIPGIWR
ncbi:MAG: AmmeMemoRadiSam system radical SAM enzyme [Candidatus Omnitrophica bacterium]|nr:AmmeMemoRadiSam system radical SAM enzyme [Candidatus Omnitrophota bacterium]